MAGLLVIGFFANLLVRPVSERFWMKEQPHRRYARHTLSVPGRIARTSETKASSQSKTPTSLIAAAWIVVAIPLAWGVYNTALGEAVHVSAREQSARAGEGPVAARTQLPFSRYHPS
jgi:hypothetical protein